MPDNKDLTGALLNGKTTSGSLAVIAIVLILNTVLPYITDRSNYVEGKVDNIAVIAAENRSYNLRSVESLKELTTAITAMNHSTIQTLQMQQKMLEIQQEILEEAKAMRQFRNGGG